MKNILIPVDFSINTEMILEKIIGLTGTLDSTIHLLHIAKPFSHLNRYRRNPFVNMTDQEQQRAETAKIRLFEIKQNLRKLLPFANISTDVVTAGNIQNKIIERACQLNAELIVIIKNTNRRWFVFSNSINATLIAKETNSAVLIVNARFIPDKIKLIVLPVCSFVPERNIELLTVLTGKHKPIIHLVTFFDKNQHSEKTSVFIDTYRTLSDFLHYHVEYKILSRSNFSKVTLDHAKYVMADLIFVNPFEEAKMNSVYGADISNMISPDSKFCVLIN